jgi:hypothetical protein
LGTLLSEQFGTLRARGGKGLDPIRRRRRHCEDVEGGEREK